MRTPSVNNAPITETPKQKKRSARMISKLTRTTAFGILSASSFGLLPNADAQTNSAESADSIVRRAYHLAEGNVMDMEGFKNLFADDGVVFASSKTYQGDQIPSILYFSHQLIPDVHREILGVHTIGNFVAVEMAFRGTFTGTFETPTGTIKGNGTKIDVRGPTCGTWKTARSRSSIAASKSVLCKNNWAYCPHLSSRDRNKLEK